MYSMVLAVHVIFPVIITPFLKRLSICPGSLQIPTGKANCRRTKALILYLINTSNEILISIRHGTTLSILLGFSQEENDLLAPLKGMLKLCVFAPHDTCQICSRHSKVQVTVARLFLDDNKKVTCSALLLLSTDMLVFCIFLYSVYVTFSS